MSFLLALIVGCSGVHPTQLDSESPWSIRVGSFRYLESSSSYVTWLHEEGVEAWVVGRSSSEDGTWYEVHVGAVGDKDDLEAHRRSLQALGYPPLPNSDYRTWSSDSFFDLSDYVQFQRDETTTTAQLGAALSAFGEFFPCHPRFELQEYSASQYTGRGPEETATLTQPNGIHLVAIDLAESDFTQTPVVGHAKYRDHVTGAELGVSMVWRSRLSAADPLGQEGQKLPGPGFDWSSRAVAEPGQQWESGKGEVVWLGWAPMLDKILIVTAEDPVAYSLVPVLFDREFCSEGVFESAALWRPLGILPPGYATTDLPIAVSTQILDQDYVDSRDGAKWAKRMKGRWAFTATFLSTDEDLWSSSVFDLETESAADDTHSNLYSSAIRRGYQSNFNQWAKLNRFDATYRTSVHGIPAWYLDHYTLTQSKELNFTYGPFIFAYSSYVLDPVPLLMDDLISRAEEIPILGAW